MVRDRKSQRWIVLSFAVLAVALLVFVLGTQIPPLLGPRDTSHPKLEVVDTVNPSFIAIDEVQAGATPREHYATYTIATSNTGDTTLFNLTLVDDIYGKPPEGVVPPNLLPGESFVWSFNASIQLSIHDTAMATGVDTFGNKASAYDDAYVFIRERPFAHLP